MADDEELTIADLIPPDITPTTLILHPEVVLARKEIRDLPIEIVSGMEDDGEDAKNGFTEEDAANALARPLQPADEIELAEGVPDEGRIV